MTDCVYKVCTAQQWQWCQEHGRIRWSVDDERDGFIHLSTAEQLSDTVARHFSGQDDLVALRIDCAKLPTGLLRWEVSRGGALFPHAYGEIPLSAVSKADPA